MIDPEPHPAPADAGPAPRGSEPDPEPARVAGGFGRLPYAVVDGGHIAGLTLAEARTLLVLVGHLNGHLAAHPGTGRLARLAGLTERGARKAVAQLERRGLLTIARGGGRGRASVYQLVANPKPAAADTGEPETRNGGSGLPPRNPEPASPEPGPGEPETLNGGSGLPPRNPEPRRPKPGTTAPETLNHGARNPEPPFPPTEKNRGTEQQQRPGAAAAELPGPERSDPRPCPPTGKPTPEPRRPADDLPAGPPAADTRPRASGPAPGPTLTEALTAAGVAEPVLSELAGRRGLSPDLVSRTAAQLERRGLGVGCLVNELRGLAAAEEARNDRRRRVAIDEEARRAAAAEGERRAAADRAETDRLLAGLPAPELARLAEEARRAMPMMLQRIVCEQQDPLKSRLWRANIVLLLRGGEAAAGELLPAGTSGGAFCGRDT